MTPSDTAAVAAFPELHHLIDLRDTGWKFHPVVDDTGVITHLYGHRHWPDDWIDILIIHHHDDTAAARSNPDGDLVWSHDGDFTDVLDHLHALPHPDDPHAPRLVIGRAPTHWAPQHPLRFEALNRVHPE